MSSTLAAVPGIASQVIAGAALLSGATALVSTRRPALALGILLDLLVAAGLLRLVGDPSWRAIATAATIIALRRLIGFGLRTGARSWTTGRTGAGRRTRGSGGDLAGRLVRPAWRL